ncbi:YhgE/Pip domain-containing protein [Leucobacter salsicius]|uniref:YhgE/Pip domain-containing protein n=1 Tax=Leucobacter salsicius TaxID=664638 RepID=UPI000344F5B7|nr:YhgE/Pip domain-containing protein [Leucobacter salsicius]
MSASLSRLKGTKPVRWSTILGILLVPLTVAGVLLWGLWNPTERLGTITAAVVNLDEPVELDGQLVPLGRVLSAELITNGTESTDEGETTQNFTWVLTDESDAQAGLDDGTYATVITIPKNFSAAATSLSGDPDEAEQAHIEIAESDRGRLIDTALSGIVTQTATSVLNQQLGEQFVGSVFVGMTELQSGISDAADGADALAGGGTKLAEGATQLADGTILLADGTRQLADGAGELSAGAGSLAGGASDLANGAGALSAGASGVATGTKGIADGASSLSDGISGFAQGLREFAQGNGTPGNPGLSGFATGMDQLAGGARVLATGDGTDANTGLAGLSDGVAQYTDGINSMLDQVTAGSDVVIQQLNATRAAIEDGTIPMPDQEAKDKAIAAIDQALAGLNGAIPEIDNLKNAGTALKAGAAQAAAGGEQLAQGVAASAAGAHDLSNGANVLVDGADKLAGGAAGLASGSSQLATGAEQLSGGVSGVAAGAGALSTGAAGLAEGTAGLATGTSELAAGVPELADGATQLADGADKSAKGAKTLAEGLGEAASGIPNYTEGQRDKISKTAITPVKAEGASDELFNSSGVPLFAGIALWAGALAMFMLLAPLWRRTRDAARGVGWITLRSALPAAAIGAAQGAIAGIALPIALGYGVTQGLAFFGLAVLAGVAFSLLVQGLAALLGGVGRFIAFTLLVVAFAVGIVSTVPGPLAAVGDASPIGAALAGFQSVATDAAGAGMAAIVLTLWAAGGLVLTALAVARARKG